MRISTLATALVVATLGFSALAATSTTSTTTTAPTSAMTAPAVAPAAGSSMTTTTTTSTLTASQKAEIEKTCRDTNKSDESAYKACVSSKEAAK